MATVEAWELFLLSSAWNIEKTILHYTCIVIIYHLIIDLNIIITTLIVSLHQCCTFDTKYELIATDLAFVFVVFLVQNLGKCLFAFLMPRFKVCGIFTFTKLTMILLIYCKSNMDCIPTLVLHVFFFQLRIKWVIIAIWFYIILYKIIVVIFHGDSACK